MALPPKGDPRRPLHLAARSVRVLGVLYVLFGLCSTLPMIMTAFRTGRSVGFNTAWIYGAAVLTYLVPGIAYLVLASYLKGYRAWAVTVLLVLVCLNLLLMLLAAAGMAMAIRSSGSSNDEVPAVIWVMAGLVLFVLVALAQLIYHLSKSYESVRHAPFGRSVQGFQPVFPVEAPPVQLVESLPQAPNER